MKTHRRLLLVFLCCCVARADTPVDSFSKHLGETPALLVAVCADDEGDLSTVTELVEQRPWRVICKGTGSQTLDRIRDWASENRLLGDRIWVVDDQDASLWLAGDMADGVWLAPGVDYARYEKDIQRVLHPGGVCVTSEGVIVKPPQPGVDEWRHPHHEPNNNVVSKDSIARLPGELRFQTHPVFAAMPNQTLFAGARVFFFSGHIAFHEREEPLLNTLTVLNAYNGLHLWSHALDPNYVVHNISKLATDSEVVFAEGGTLWMLDAATGRERGRFSAPTAAASAGDTHWKWIVQDKETLWAAFGPPDGSVAPHRRKGKMGHWPWNVANLHYKSIVNKFGAASTLAAFRYPEMELMWSVREPEPFDTRALCMEGGRIFQLASQKFMAARDAKSGKELWRHTPETSKKLFDAIGTSLKRQGWGLGWATYNCTRASQDVICIAGPSFKKTIGVGFDTGDLLWTADIPSPHPFFYDDALYLMPRVARPTATCLKVEPLTGKTIESFDLGVIGSCTRLTVTPSQFYYRPGGGEGKTVCFDLNEQALIDYQGIVRPGCFDGVVPANGRLYWMPLACDCWQVHGTFSMAPRVALKRPTAESKSQAWKTPRSKTPAALDDWPMYRADSAGTATVAATVGKTVREVWRRRIAGNGLSAPVVAQGRVYVGAADGSVRALAIESGKDIWQTFSHAAVLYPPAYWQGRVIFGSCDGMLYGVDALDGRVLGRVQLAPEKRFVNIMDRFMSAWPLGGGVVLSAEGIAYAAAGSTAADGTIAAALDVATGSVRWRQAFTPDQNAPKLSFGVQSNLLLKDRQLYINGGAPVGIVALDTHSGNARVVSQLEAGMEMFLEPDGKLLCSGPELYSHQQARTTIFNRHQGRAYFRIAERHIGLVDSRLFCTKDPHVLDRLVDLMNTDPKTGGKMGGGTVPWDVMQVPMDDAMLWAGHSADLRGLAVGTNGLVVLHQDSVEGLSVDGQSLWTVALPVPPVRWGVALTRKHCVVTLSDGSVICLAHSRSSPEDGV